jgi:hypothetical protein
MNLKEVIGLSKFHENVSSKAFKKMYELSGKGNKVKKTQ